MARIVDDTMTPVIPNDSTTEFMQLRSSLTDKQLETVKKTFYDIRASFSQSGVRLGAKDKELANQIKIYIIKDVLAREF